MKTPPPFLTTPLLVLVGCTHAAAQGPSSTARVPDAGPLERVHVYEVAAEQAAALQEAPPFLEVSGSAEVAVDADRARIDFIVETEGGTAAEASTANAGLMEKVIAALRTGGARELRIDTHGYSLQPRYTRPDEKGAPRIAGYTAHNNVRVTTASVDGVGRLIDAAVSAGANRVGSLVFEASDTEPARLEALRMAVSRARAEAGAIAEAMGVVLGPPLEVRGGAQVPVVGPFPALMRAEAVTPIEPGQQMVSASVTIRYRLGGGA